MGKRGLRDLMMAYEKMILQQTLTRNSNNKDATARVLGITRRALDKKLLAHGIGQPRYARPLPIGRVDDDREG